MKSEIKHISNTKKQIKVSVPKETVDGAMKEAAKKVGQKADIKGFRKGKIPAEMLEKHYGGDILMEGLNKIVNESYIQVLNEHTLRPLLEPKFDIKPIQKGSAYDYEVTVEVLPQFEVQDYLEIPLKKIAVEISEAEIDAELKKAQESRAELDPLPDDQALEKGLVAVLDIDGTIEGKAFEGGSSKSQLLEYGQGHFLKDFEDNLAGLKKGDEKTFKMTFPADYKSDLAGKEVEFKVKIIALHKKRLLPLDDDFAKDLGRDTLAIFKEEIVKGLTAQKERMNRGEYAKEVVEHLLKKNVFDIPEGVLEHEMKHAQGQTKEDIAKRIRTDFILESVAVKEAVRVEPKEIEVRLREIAMATRQPPEVIKQHYNNQQNLSQLVGRLTLEKALNLIIDKASFK